MKRRGHYCIKLIYPIAVVVLLLAIPFPLKNTYYFPQDSRFFELDILGNLYFISNSTIHKYAPSTGLKSDYSRLTFGPISTLDVSDPMNILVYYSDYNKLVMLDNKLSIKNSVIDISDLGYDQSSVACLSYNGGFWIYDPVGRALIRFNQSLEKTDNSGDLYSITGYQINPVQLIERDNQLVLRDKKNGIFVFDRYGNYIRRVPFFSLEDMYIRSGTWQLLRNDTVYFFHPNTMDVDTLRLALDGVKEFRSNSKIMYLLLKNNTFKSIAIKRL